MRDDLWILALLGVVLAIWYAHYDRVKTAEQTGFVDGGQNWSRLTSNLKWVERAFEVYKKELKNNIFVIIRKAANMEEGSIGAELVAECERQLTALDAAFELIGIRLDSEIGGGKLCQAANASIQSLRGAHAFIMANNSLLLDGSMVDLSWKDEAFRDAKSTFNDELMVYYRATGVSSMDGNYLN